MRETKSALSLYSTFLIAVLQSRRDFFFEGLAKSRLSINRHLAAPDAAVSLFLSVLSGRGLKCVKRRRLKSNLKIVLASFVLLGGKLNLFPKTATVFIGCGCRRWPCLAHGRREKTIWLRKYF